MKNDQPTRDIIYAAITTAVFGIGAVVLALLYALVVYYLLK